jgi:hypothetical protein
MSIIQLFRASLIGVLFLFLPPKRGDRYIGGSKCAEASPLEKGSSPARSLVSVHVFTYFATSVGCTDDDVDLTTECTDDSGRVGDRPS